MSFQIGHPFGIRFKKGHTPWNKGLRARDDRRITQSVKAMHIATKGKSSWNAGLKTGIIPKTVIKKGEHKNSKTEFKKGDSRITREGHYNWKGDDIGYQSLHGWLRYNLGKPNGKPKKCMICGKVTNLHWANIDHKYKRNLKDYISLCLWCHRKYDKKFKGKRKERYTRCLVLAAGRGKRLNTLTTNLPKPLIEVNRKPIIDYVIDNLKTCGFKKIIVNLHYLPLLIMKHLGNTVDYSPEPSLLGTAGAIRQIKEWRGNILIVANGDTITNLDIAKMVTFHGNKGTIVTVFTHHDAIHNGGTFIFNKEILKYIPPNKPYSIHKDLLPDLIKRKIPITLFKSNATYFDCSTPEKLAKARRFFGE